MSMLLNVLFATHAKSTHHKLALDALRLLRHPDAERWKNLFLKNYDGYLTGAKAPDDQFKDFKNHVLHVGDGFWGGACEATKQWYDRTVTALRGANWADAVYNAGVCSHYFTDPCMPFHTGQSEEEGAVHRAAEWSITCSYDELRNIIESALGGYPRIDAPAGANWLTKMVQNGATAANPHYWPIIRHYNLAKGVKDPPAGLDQEIKDRVARCLAHAAAGWACVLDRAFAEAAVTPPAVELSLTTFLATLKMPIKYVTKKLADAQERATVERIFAEVQQTGKAVESLPEDDKQVRAQHAAEVLKTPIEELNLEPVEPAGQEFGTGTPARRTPTRASTQPVKIVKPVTTPKLIKTATPAAKPKPAAPRKAAPKPAVEKAPTPTPAPKPVVESTPEPIVTFTAPPAPAPVVAFAPAPAAKPERQLRFYLDRNSPIADAPSIGNKTANRFIAVGVHTVNDLLMLNPERVAERLDVKWLDTAKIREFQAQAHLAVRVPQLRGHDAQILVASGVTDPDVLARMDPAALMKQITPFLESKEAERVLRSSPKPDLDEIRDWIAWARDSRPLMAA